MHSAGSKRGFGSLGSLEPQVKREPQFWTKNLYNTIERNILQMYTFIAIAIYTAIAVSR